MYLNILGNHLRAGCCPDQSKKPACVRLFWQAVLRLTWRARSVLEKSGSRDPVMAELRNRQRHDDLRHIGWRLDRKLVAFKLQEIDAQELQSAFDVTMQQLQWIRRGVQKTLSQGDVDTGVLENRLAGIGDLELLVQSKVQWLERTLAASRPVRDFGPSGSVTHFLISGDSGKPQWRLIMNWKATDLTLSGFDPGARTMVTWERRQVLDWRAR